jgi:hypothetical protein
VTASRKLMRFRYSAMPFRTLPNAGGWSGCGSSDSVDAMLLNTDKMRPKKKTAPANRGGE